MASKKETSTPLDPPTLAVCADPAKDMNLLKAAARLAVDLNRPFLEKPVRSGYDMLLAVTPDRMELRVLRGPAELKGGNPISAEPGGIDTRSPAGRTLNQPIAKAVGIKKRSDPAPTVIDTTAGYGEDSWLLASLGCRVLTVERNKIVAMLLRDGLLRAGASDPATLQRIHVVSSDSRHLLRRLARLDGHPGAPGDPADDLPDSMRDFLEPDVVYIDPMFPGAATRKTAERKPMRILRWLVGEDMDCGELFDWAMAAARKRIVVKRPAKAEPLRGKPTMKFEGKGVRYDVYVVKK